MLIGADTDTTAAILSHSVKMMALHPEAVSKAHIGKDFIVPKSILHSCLSTQSSIVSSGHHVYLDERMKSRCLTFDA